MLHVEESKILLDTDLKIISLDSKNDFVEESKILLDTDLKIISLD